MKIKVYSRGETDIDADLEYQEPMIREAIDQRGDVASAIIDYTDSERSDISHDEYAVVTGDNGLELWRGWLTGDQDAPAPDADPAVPGQAADWWICDGPLPAGGKKILGPFATQELALKVRTYVEKAEKRTDLWVDDEPAGSAA